MKTTRYLATLGLVLASLEGVEAQQPSLQEGDLLVGATQAANGGGIIARVRDGNAVTYCQPGSIFFYGPNEVVVDSQGRVVFVAILGPTANYGYGLFRCNSMGSPPELLGVFSGTIANTYLPNPFPSEIFAAVTSLHLAARRGISIDDSANNGLPQIGTDEVYVVALGSMNQTTGIGTTRSVRYHPADGSWDEGPEPAQDIHLNKGGMVYHAGSTYSVEGGTLRKEKTPLQFIASGTAYGVDYHFNLSLFGGRKEVANLISDDEAIPNVDSGCLSHDGITDSMPLVGCCFGSMTGFYNVIYDESGGLGLVIATQNVPYMTQVSEALINDDASDDKAQYFHDSYVGCAAVPSFHYLSILPFYSSDSSLYPWQANGVAQPFGSLVSSSRGVMGTQRGAQGSLGRVIHVVAGDHVEVVCATLINPQGIGAFPSQVSAGSGTTVVIRLDFPVNVLVTDASGRRIGVDPNTGLAVNDFGEDGFDSGPGEPRFFAIMNPAPGPYLVHEVGAGDGPFALNVYSADLTHQNGNRIQATGVVAVGSISNHYFTLGSDVAVAFLAHPVPPSFRSIHRALDGSVSLGIHNMPGLALTLQSSADLTSWTTLASPVPGTNPYVFTDTTASGVGTRFYRAFYP